MPEVACSHRVDVHGFKIQPDGESVLRVTEWMNANGHNIWSLYRKVQCSTASLARELHSKS